MSAQDAKALLTLADFKGIDYTSSGPKVKPGFAIQAVNCNPTIIEGALSPERGRVPLIDFAPALASVTSVCSVQFYDVAGNSKPMYLAGGTSASSSSTFATFLYDPSTVTFIPCPFSGTAPTYLAPYDQAIQYGGVVYMNNGFRLFLNQPTSAPTFQLFAWQYPAPMVAGNIGLIISAGNGPVATSASTSAGIGANTVTPFSMQNIVNGIPLIADVGSQQELITASGCTSTTFNATFTMTHDTGFGLWCGLASSAAQYDYLITRTSTMPDGSISETSVDLNQFQSPPNIQVPALPTGQEILVNPLNGYLWVATHTYDGLQYTTNLYRTSTLQPGYFFVANLGTTPTSQYSVNSQFVDIWPDAAIVGNAQLQTNRDAPPCVAGTYGVDSNQYNFASLAIHKNRAWVYAISQTTSTLNVPEVQLWYSTLGRPWEFNQLNQVLSLQSDVVNQYGNGSILDASATYDNPYGNDPLALAEIGTVLGSWSRRQTWATYGDDPTNFLPRQIFNIGTVSRHSVTPTTGGVLWASENGPYFFDGSTPQWIAEGVRGLLQANALGLAIAQYDLARSIGVFANMTWYWSFPTLGYTLSYYMPTGTWLSKLPYSPAGFAGSSFTPAYPTVYTANGAASGAYGGVNEVIATRLGSPSKVDWWFASADTDLGLPQVFSWSGPLSWSEKVSAEKVFDKVLVAGPTCSGMAWVTLTTDPGAPTATASTMAFNLALGTRQIQSVGDGQGGLVRAFLGQLSVTASGIAGQAAPQLWHVGGYGTIGRDLVIPV